MEVPAPEKKQPVSPLQHTNQAENPDSAVAFHLAFLNGVKADHEAWAGTSKKQ